MRPSAPSIARRRGTASGGKVNWIQIIWFSFAVVFLLTIGTGLYGLHYVSHRSLSSELQNVRSTTANIPRSEASFILANVKKDFETRYGDFSDQLLQKGLSEFGSIDATAARMVEASRAGRPFVMAFSGYSVTVGRGNFFNQSFPFEVQRILAKPMEKLLGIPLVVRNAAIGGIPSFPYSFCLEHFVGGDPDVISWDYSMNEGKSESGLEAFLRQTVQQLSKRPMIIMLDKNTRRSKLLEEYTKRGLIADAITVGRKDDVLQEHTLEQLKPLPPGFQEWDEFGAPASCPGRGAWHPKRQEHSMIGWTIAMHFLKVLERAYGIIHDEPNSLDDFHPNFQTRLTFPAALGPLPKNDPEVNELLFGHKVGESDSYMIKDLSCRTSFIPATDESKTLPSIVVSGFAEPDLDIMVDRTEDHYKEGWVLDVSTMERKTKRKVERCGGLGYIDMKIALYGIPDSGKLRLWLPFEGQSHADHEHTNVDTNARHWFDDLLFCEANEKRPDEACKLYEDMQIVVGGVEVKAINEVSGAAEYLQRKTCVNVGIPGGAQITTLGNVRTVDGEALSREDKARLGGGRDDAIGIVVDVLPRPKVTLDGGACCLSHVVWEMH